MKNLLIVTMFSILYACATKKPISKQEVNNNNFQPLIKYQTLNKHKIKRLFKLETDTHRLGQVTFYKYYPSGNIQKETTYENKNGKLVFEYESGYKYNNDILTYKYQYSEIPSYKYPEFIEWNYMYLPKNKSVVVQKIDSQIDSTFICLNKNPMGKILKKSEIRKRTYKGRNRVMESYTTNYYYNNSNELIKENRVNEKYGDTIQTDYKYSKNQLLTSTYKSNNYTSKKTYSNGLLSTVEETYSNGEKIINIYNYNKRAQEVFQQKIKKGKRVYSYKTYYNKRNLKKKYEMINENDGKSGVWLFEYGKKGHLIYKIDLYAKE